jgi:hypothetical protein
MSGWERQLGENKSAIFYNHSNTFPTLAYKYYLMTLKEAAANLDFAKSCFLFGNQYAGNTLRTNETILTTPSVLVFANGELDKRENLEVVDVRLSEDPSEFLKENQDLAKKVSHIIVIAMHEFENNPNMYGEQLVAVRGKYQGFAKDVIAGRR